MKSNFNLEPLDKLKRARIQIQQKNSFFAYLSLYLKFQEVKDEFMEMPCGVDATGNFYYKADWIKELSEKQVEGLVIHEIGHLFLLHLTRRKNRDPEIWNVAADIIVNNIAIANNFELPEGGLIPYGNLIRLNNGTVEIENIDKKTCEEVFDELCDKLPVVEIKKIARMDSHMDKGPEQKPRTEQETRAIEEDWMQKAEEAVTAAKMKGDLPAGLEKLVKGLHRSQIHWKSLLQRFIQSYIPYDLDMQKVHKKSVSAGYFIPSYLKEKIKVVVGVDLSGSIGEKEIADFMSEIVGMANAYQDRMEMILLTHDTEVKDEYRLENGVAQKAKKLKLHGGGGTSHQDIFDKIKTKYRDCKVAVFLTDMYSDLQSINLDKYPFGKLFVVSKGGNNYCKLNGTHQIIKLEND